MTESQAALTSDQIAAAEKLFNLNFSAEQREQMLKTLSDRLAHFDSLRAAPLDNAVPLALNFNVNAADNAPAAVPRSLRHEPAARRHATRQARRNRFFARDATGGTHAHASDQLARADRDVP